MALILMIWVTIVVQWTNAEECEPNSSMSSRIPERVYIVMYDGPPNVPQNETMAARSLGSCLSTRKHANHMMDYFSNYGFDMSKISKDPYVVYDGPDYSLTPLAENPSYPSRLYASFDKGYGKVVNKASQWASWAIAAKRDTSGPAGTIPQGYWTVYGTARMDKEGKDVCITYHGRTPHEPIVPGKTSRVDALCHNEDLGSGEFRGLIVATENRVSVSYSITFMGN